MKKLLLLLAATTIISCSEKKTETVSTGIDKDMINKLVENGYSNGYFAGFYEAELHIINTGKIPDLNTAETLYKIDSIKFHNMISKKIKLWK